MIKTIENDLVRVTVKTRGAEVVSFYDKTNNYEHCYDQKDQAWGYINPILFPMIGSYDPLIFKQKQYIQKNHGILRTQEFTFEQVFHDRLILSFSFNDQTYTQYPYKFKIVVEYQLISTCLEIKYRLINLDDSMMPFVFGLHPAFQINDLDQCQVLFEQAEIDDTYQLIDQQCLKLKKAHFKQYGTLIYQNLKSKYVILENDQKHQLKIDISQFKYLALWTILDSSFICIEPWLANASQKNQDDFTKYQDVLVLKPKDEFNISYAWQCIIDA